MTEGAKGDKGDVGEPGEPGTPGKTITTNMSHSLVLTSFKSCVPFCLNQFALQTYFLNDK